MVEKFQSFTLPEINQAFENNVSFSQYSTYLSCPHQWQLKYVKKLSPKEDNIFSIFGTSIHETIQHYLTLLYTESEEIAEDLDLEEYFKERFRENYKLGYDKTKVQFTNALEMGEFFKDAVAILEWFKRYRKSHFTTHKIKLLGIEVPLLFKIKKSLYFKGFLDIVLYDESEDILHIYDIKTSTWGWGAKVKKDEAKLAQLLLYKEYLSKQYGIDINKIEIQFYITRRKLYENSDYEIPRIQIFKPASGKIKRKKATDGFNKFIEECFNRDGEVIDKEHEKTPSLKNCKYCYFKNRKELCEVGIEN